MSPTPRPASSPHHSWRAQARTGDAANKVKRVNRVLLSLAGLALAGALAWLLVRIFLHPSVRLVCLPVIEYGVGTVPSIPFAAEDIRELEKSSFDGPPTVLEALQTSAGIATLENRLSGIPVRPNDTLILYVSAHGVSDGATAYLLCSDYLRDAQRRPASPSRHKLRDLLDQIRRCPAKLKLLILDVGHLDSDPRLGMFVNEFPRLLEEELTGAEAADSRLWVLTANRQFETSRVSTSAGRSVFGYFVAEGLKGAADRDGNGIVELDELSDYVRTGVADWVHWDSDGLVTQTPWLLQDGKGSTDQPPAGLELLPVSDQGDPETDPAAEPADGQADSDPKAQAKRRKEVRQLLAKAWQLHDRMQDRTGTEPWSPVDYAPHLWRQYQGLLLGYEMRYRSGEAFDAKDLARQLERNVLALEEILQHGKLLSGIDESVVGRLAAARRQFREYKRKPGVADEAIQLKNDLVFRAPYYVRWQAAAPRSPSRPDRSYQPISDLLQELPELVERLEALAGAARAGEHRDDVEEDLKYIEELKKTLADRRKSIETAGLNEDAEALVRKATDDPNAKRVAAAMDALLATPLLPADLRMRLLQARDRLDQPLPRPAESEESSAPAVPSVARWQRRLADRAKLEQQLVLLADPAAELALPGEISNPDDPRAREKFWRQYRRFGQDLGDFYRGLPGRVQRDLAAADSDGARPWQRLLRLVDARDARRIPEEVCRLAVPEIALPGAKQTLLAVEEQEQALAVFLDDPEPFDITIRAADFSSTDARVTLMYDPDEMTIGGPDAEQPVAPAQPVPIRLEQDRTVLKYTAVAKVDADRPTVLTVVVEAGDARTEREFRFQLPPSDMVDLQVRRVYGPEDKLTDRWIEARGNHHVELRPFPNRITPYRFALVNRSGRAKQIEVQLLAVPKLRPGQQLSRRLLLDGSGNLRPQLETLAGPAKMSLPAGQDPVPIPFAAPKPPDAAEGAPAPEEDKPPPKPLVTRGMACAIRDVAKNEWKWIEWIDFSPLTPGNYLAPQVSYRARQGKITIDLETLDPERLPPFSAEDPITVRWANTEALGANPAMDDRAAVAAPGSVPEALFAEVPSRPGKVVPVHLTVDGYPRAFVYPVPCDQDIGPIPPDADRKHIEITMPEDGHAHLVSHPEAGPVVVEFQVDAPADAFQEDRGVVEVGINKNRDRTLRPEEVQHSFTRDRQVKIYLHQAGSPGSVKPGSVRIDARVSDFQVALDPGGLKNQEVDVVARLLLAIRGLDTNRRQWRDSVRVILDGSPPEFGAIDASPRQIPLGKPVRITVEASDASGVKEIKIGFDQNGNDKLDQDEKPKTVKQVGSDGKWHAELPTDGLAPGPDYHVLILAADNAGHPASKTEVDVEIVPAGPPPKKTSTIQGLALLGTKPCPDIKVSLNSDNHSDEKTSDQNGQFTFQDVPEGKYTFDAEGIVNNFPVKGSAEVKLPQADDPVAVRIKLAW